MTNRSEQRWYVIAAEAYEACADECVPHTRPLLALYRCTRDCVTDCRETNAPESPPSDWDRPHGTVPLPPGEGLHRS
ncbi:hypothetical protein [Halorubrum sp. DTA46]|uniref:hypothetical protein n=1 Tax=Halorubrum sp. DTA46 TaxID=3402162 RepID=UPI003AAEDC66